MQDGKYDEQIGRILKIYILRDLKANKINILTGSLIGFGLTILSYFVAHIAGWINIEDINHLEAFAVWTSYLCTWLCVKQTRLNYPIGIVTTFAYSILFWQFGLTALAIFNLYLVFSLTYGYIVWGSDENTKPVTYSGPLSYLGYIFVAAAIYFILVIIHGILGQEIGVIDIWLSVASGVAQFLLDRKKIENWIIWIGVNIFSIGLYFNTGLYIVAFQYAFFLANAFYGYYSWKKTMKSEIEIYEDDLNKLVFPDKPIIFQRTLVFD